MTTMPKHSSAEIASLRDVVAGGGGRTVVVIGEAEPYFVGVRAAPTANRFEAVLQIMGDTDYERIVAVTGGGTDGFLPDNFWVSDNFRVGRDAGGWMLRGSKPGGAAPPPPSPPAPGKLDDDHNYGAAAKRSLTHLGFHGLAVGRLDDVAHRSRVSRRSDDRSQERHAGHAHFGRHR
jgi:hypothetical protein